MEKKQFVEGPLSDTAKAIDQKVKALQYEEKPRGKYTDEYVLIHTSHSVRSVCVTGDSLACTAMEVIRRII